MAALAVVILYALSDLLGFHIKLYFLRLSTYQYILRRRAGESKLQIASSACQSKVYTVSRKAFFTFSLLGFSMQRNPPFPCFACSRE